MFLYLLLPVEAFTSTQQVRIGLFYYWQVKSVLVRAEKGGWTLSSGGVDDYCLQTGEILYIAWLDDRIYIRGMDRYGSAFREVILSSADSSSLISLQPVNPFLEKRIYRGAVEIRPEPAGLGMVLVADLEDYLAGVVKAEGGYQAAPDFYKAQAVLCRTYALRHPGKHAGEGFDLCDAVHCQSFRGMIPAGHPIYQATLATKGLVVTDRQGKLVTAAYHSNCGGETQAAGNVWIEALPYLVSVTDPFCLNSRNARWSFNIPLNEWRSYLDGAGVPHELLADPSVFAFEQPDRKKYYAVGNHRLELRKIREDWDLKSAFFSTRISGEDLIIQGRGNGHGVGMCQEGAMKMASQGYSFEQIIRYYFSPVFIVEFVPGMVPEPGKH